MKKNLRILMGILFPFVLILTVTSISKALKPDKNQIILEESQKSESKTPPSNPSGASILLTTHQQE